MVKPSAGARAAVARSEELPISCRPNTSLFAVSSRIPPAIRPFELLNSTFQVETRISDPAGASTQTEAWSVTGALSRR